jgi:hypothetical protein
MLVLEPKIVSGAIEGMPTPMLSIFWFFVEGPGAAHSKDQQTSPRKLAVICLSLQWPGSIRRYGSCKGFKRARREPSKGTRACWSGSKQDAVLAEKTSPFGAFPRRRPAIP